MPMPPSWAMAIAKRASVTVSIAAETTGMFSSSLRVRRLLREASRGRMREWAGRRRTSSKVSAFWITRMDLSRKAALYASRSAPLSRPLTPPLLRIHTKRPVDLDAIAVRQQRVLVDALAEDSDGCALHAARLER